jgi:pimeloyl-ACP methyl ester carboxylesterase
LRPAGDLENEDKLTADRYRKQLETNYALKLPPEQIAPFIDARFNIKGSAEYPRSRWLRAFASSAQMIYREPVAHEIPLLTQPTLFVMGADDYNAPGKSECTGSAALENGGQNAELSKALAAKMKNGRAEAIPNTGHLVFLETPAKYDELVLGFLAQ